MTGLRNLHADLERDVAGLLNTDIVDGVCAVGNGVHKHYAAVSEWWSGYAECVEEDEGDTSILKSSVIWSQLKRDRADICAEMTVSEFKDVLCLIVPSSNFVRSRGKGGVDILRYRVRSVSVPPSNTVVVATECVSDVSS